MPAQTTAIARTLRLFQCCTIVHLVVGAFLVFMACSLGERDPASMTGVSLPHQVLLFVLDNPAPFCAAILACDFLSLYILSTPSAARRRTALAWHCALVVSIALFHIIAAAIASHIGTIRTPTATHIIEPDVWQPIAALDALLALPLILSILGHRLRSIHDRRGCPNCGYDLAGLPAAPIPRCPECGAAQPTGSTSNATP